MRASGDVGNACVIDRGQDNPSESAEGLLDDAFCHIENRAGTVAAKALGESPPLHARHG